MALAKKGSRCGKYYDHYPSGGKTQYNGIQRCVLDEHNLVSGRQAILDLCEDCMSAFDKFMIDGGRFDDKT